MNPITTNDLLDHATTQMKGIIDRASDLFEEDTERDVFMVTLFGRMLVHCARCIYVEEDEDARSPESIVGMALVLAAYLHGKLVIEHLDQGKIARRARVTTLKLNQAARALADHESKGAIEL